MGARGSKQHPPEGCWELLYDQHLFAGIFRWGLPVNFQLDCDCHAMTACPWGEPSMPPLHEFMDPSVPQQVYAVCPTTNPLPLRPQRHTWHEPKPDSRLPEIWPERPSRGGRNRNTHGKRQEGQPAPERQHLQHVLQTLNSLSADKQEALERKFAVAVRQLRDTAAANHTAHHVDPRLVLSLLLADPHARARSVVESLPRAMADTLGRCAKRAIDQALGQIRLHATVATRSQEPLEPEYRAYLQHLAEVWAKARLGLTESNSGSSTAVDAMCDQVYHQAVSNVEHPDRGQRYVASHGHIMTALGLELATSWDNPLVEAMKTPLAAGSNLGWSESNLTAVFGAALPALTVGMGFFTLSLYAGAGGYGT